MCIYVYICLYMCIYVLRSQNCNHQYNREGDWNSVEGGAQDGDHNNHREGVQNGDQNGGTK